MKTVPNGVGYNPPQVRVWAQQVPEHNGVNWKAGVRLMRAEWAEAGASGS